MENEYQQQDWQALKQSLSADYGLVPLQGAGLASIETLSVEELERLLADRLNTLIRKDFGAFVQLLYQIDIDELRLKRLLAQHPGEDAGRIIAPMIIQRQLEKIRTRRIYSGGAGGDWKEV